MFSKFDGNNPISIQIYCFQDEINLNSRETQRLFLITIFNLFKIFRKIIELLIRYINYYKCVTLRFGREGVVQCSVVNTVTSAIIGMT